MPSRIGQSCIVNAMSKCLFRLSKTRVPKGARNVKPGGWAEFIDLDLTWTSPDGSLKEEHAGKKFNNVFIKTCRDTGIEACPGLYLEGWMKDAGFQNVRTEKFILPVGTWPKDKTLVRRFLSSTTGPSDERLTIDPERGWCVELPTDQRRSRSIHTGSLHSRSWIFRRRSQGDLCKHQKGDQGSKDAYYVLSACCLRTKAGIANCFVKRRIVACCMT